MTELWREPTREELEIALAEASGTYEVEGNQFIVKRTTEGGLEAFSARNGASTGTRAASPRRHGPPRGKPSHEVCRLLWRLRFGVHPSLFVRRSLRAAVIETAFQFVHGRADRRTEAWAPKGSIGATRERSATYRRSVISGGRGSEGRGTAEAS